jgi:hypothetical protein
MGRLENTLAAVMQWVLLPQPAFAGHSNTVFGPFKMLPPTQWAALAAFALINSAAVRRPGDGCGNTLQRNFETETLARSSAVGQYENMSVAVMQWVLLPQPALLAAAIPYPNLRRPAYCSLSHGVLPLSCRGTRHLLPHAKYCNPLV